MPIRLQSPFKFYARAPVETKASEPKPTTFVDSGNEKKYWFSARSRDNDLLTRMGQAYTQGGLVAEAIDSYPLFIMANGVRFESPDKGLQKLCEQRALETNFLSSLWCGIVDCCVWGDGFQEQTLDREGNYWGPTPRSAKQFEIRTDRVGLVQAYRYFYKEGFKEDFVDLPPEKVFHLRLWDQSGDVYGLSLVGRALKEIERDFMVADSTANAIERHGSPKYHIQPGQPGEKIANNVLTSIGLEFKDMNARHEFVTQPDFKIGVLDATGVTGVEEYNRMTITRLCTALGVPEEVLGLGRGSTEATANVRLQAWYKKVAALQRRIEPQVNNNIVDKWTGKPGACKMVFNDVSTVDEMLEVQWMAMLMQATPMDPFANISPEFIRERLGIDEVMEDREDDEEPLRPEQEVIER